MCMSTHTPADIRLTVDDIQYMCDHVVHERNVFGRTDSLGVISQLDARLYESLKTSLTSLKYLVNVFDLRKIKIELNRDTSSTSVAVSIYSQDLPDYISEVIFSIKYRATTDFPYGEFIGTIRLCPSFTEYDIFRYHSNVDDIMSYDMVFPMPSLFRRLMTEKVYHYTHDNVYATSEEDIYA